LAFVLAGVREEADLYLAARFLRKHLEPALTVGTLQKQGYDHVLREEEREQEAFAGICHYILQNPVRAGLAREAAEYAFSGSVIPGYPDLRIYEAGYWDLYWRICHRLTAATSARAWSDRIDGRPISVLEVASKTKPIR
jgi:putative transposase